MKGIYQLDFRKLFLTRIKQESFIVEYALDEETGEEKEVYIRDSKKLEEAIEELKELLKKDLLDEEDKRKLIIEGRPYIAITLMNYELAVPKDILDTAYKLIELKEKKKNK
jgi:plasmid rolling circle replication initiator protein Rep